MRIAWALRKLAKALLGRHLPMWSNQMDKGSKSLPVWLNQQVSSGSESSANDVPDAPFAREALAYFVE